MQFVTYRNLILVRISISNCVSHHKNCDVSGSVGLHKYITMYNAMIEKLFKVTTHSYED